jgi:dissimilatory sulfite reductase (desulfoviridin) alpha/beta subunit
MNMQYQQNSYIPENYRQPMLSYQHQYSQVQQQPQYTNHIYSQQPSYGQYSYGQQQKQQQIQPTYGETKTKLTIQQQKTVLQEKLQNLSNENNTNSGWFKNPFTNKNKQQIESLDAQINIIDTNG